MKQTLFWLIPFAAIAVAVLLIGCTAQTGSQGGSYTSITQDEAKEMMLRSDGHVIVDVRRQDEYDGGHIPGAILIPNEEIDTTPPAALPDKAQILLIYCRSGRRSKEAAQKLADMGYTNVYEFGGILDWDGETTVETEKNEIKTAVLSFDSFDGGGPGFTAVLEDPSVVSIEKTIEYGKINHEEIDGAAFTVRFTLTGLKPGSTVLTIEERSPIADNLDHSYAVTVADDLSVSVDMLEVTDPYAPEAVRPVPTLVIAVGDRCFYAALEDNSSADALAERLSEEPIALELHDYGGFEKVGELPWELPRNDETITAEAGDLILYQGNQLSIYYDENTWSFTRLARIGGASKEELLSVLGEGDASVLLWIEWSE